MTHDQAILDELRTYRAHRFAITRLENSDEFALFSPAGELLGIGNITDLAPHITTGEAQYSIAADRWIARGKPTASSISLLTTLGLLPKPTTPKPIVRRI